MGLQAVIKKHWLLAILLSGFPLAGNSRATVITFPGSGIPFQVTATTGVGLVWAGGGLGTSASPWLLNETYTYTNNNFGPISLDYKYVGPPAAEPADADYYFLVSETLTNNTGKTWAGYNWAMKDNNNTTFNNAFHPNAAHFHSGTLTSYAPFATLTPAGNSGTAAMAVSNGSLPTGQNFSPSQVKLHDLGNNLGIVGGVIQNKPGANAGVTEFTVTEQPTVPEPAGFLLFAVAGFGLLLRRRRTA